MFPTFWAFFAWFSPKRSSALFTAWNFQLKFWNIGVGRWVSFWGFPAWQVGTVMFSRGYVQIKCEAELEESVASLGDGWANVSCFPIVCLVLSGNQRVEKWQRWRDPNIFLCWIEKYEMMTLFFDFKFWLILKLMDWIMDSSHVFSISKRSSDDSLQNLGWLHKFLWRKKHRGFYEYRKNMTRFQTFWTFSLSQTCSIKSVGIWSILHNDIFWGDPKMLRMCRCFFLLFFLLNFVF